MADASDSDSGCMSMISSCFKKPHKEQLKGRISSNRTVTTAPPIPTTTQSPNRTPTSDEPPALLAASSHVSLSASVTDGPTPRPAADQNSTVDDGPVKLDGLWQEAYQEADTKTRTWIDEIVSDATPADPFQDMVDLVRRAEERHKEKPLKLRFGDREFLWRDYANRVVSVVTAIGDIAIPFAPAPSSAVWSPVKVLLKANVPQCEDLVAIMGCTDLVLCLVRRGMIYEKVYLGELPLPMDKECLRQKLVQVYTSCLNFLSFVNESLQRGSLGRFFVALVDSGRGEKRVAEVKALEQGLEFAARVCEAREGDVHRKLLHSLEEPLKRVDESVTRVLRKLEDRDRKDAMDYISVVPVGSHHNEKIENRTEGTCEWLVDHAEFRKWEESACSSLLWLQGSIGTGKSFLSSKVIDRFRVDKKITRQSQDDHDEGFAFFYCYRNDTSRRSTASILRSYVRQLSEVPRRPESIHEASYALYQKKEQIQNHIGIEECKIALRDMINSYPRTTLILDALDECEIDTREKIAEFFKHLVQESERPVKIFIASRMQDDIEIALSSLNGPQILISINTADNREDIQRFVRSQIANSTQWRHVPTPTKVLVEKTLVDKSDGMSGISSGIPSHRLTGRNRFRWTFLQWEQLKELIFDKDIRERLGNLPEGLRGAYDEIYDQCHEGCERAMLQQAVRWVLCAREPLNSCQLLSAIKVEVTMAGDKSPLAESDVNEDTLKIICRNLIVRDSSLGVWKFPHASVAEYFAAKDEPWIKNAEAEITVVLITCLTNCCAAASQDWSPPDAEDKYELFWKCKADLHDTLDPRHPLQTYTQVKWIEHIRNLWENNIKPTNVVQALERFLGESPQQGSSAYHIFVQYIMTGHWSYYMMRRFMLNKSPVFGIVAMGLHQPLDGWWGKDLDAALLPSLLQIAIYFGYADLWKSFISRGFDLNEESDTEYGSPLAVAVVRGELDCARLLVDHGVDANKSLEFGIYGSPLVAAVAFGRLDCARFLVDHGADANKSVEAGYYGSPLAAAVARGHLDCARFLVDHGADANKSVEVGYYGSPLVAAVAFGQLECARLLVDHGAGVNKSVEVGKYGSPLAAAAARDHLDCVRFVIDHSASVDEYLPSGAYGCALAAAILEKGSIQMVKFLIEEQNADLEKLRFFRPRRKFEGELIKTREDYERCLSNPESESRIWYRNWLKERFKAREGKRELTNYLIRDCHIDADLLISLGVPEWEMPSPDMSL